MNRILGLQVIPIVTLGVNPNPDNQGNSSSSDHNCACSTNSNVACLAGGEFVVL